MRKPGGKGMLYPIENRVREVKNLSGIWNFKID